RGVSLDESAVERQRPAGPDPAAVLGAVAVDLRPALGVITQQSPPRPDAPAVVACDVRIDLRPAGQFQVAEVVDPAAVAKLPCPVRVKVGARQQEPPSRRVVDPAPVAGSLVVVNRAVGDRETATVVVNPSTVTVDHPSVDVQALDHAGLV